MSITKKREHRVMDTLTRAAECDGLADPRREARTALLMMDGIQVRWLRDRASVDLVADWNAYADFRWPRQS